MTEKNEIQPNIEDHNKKQFCDMVQQGMKEGGLHLTASKGFGKSRLLFSIAQSLRSLPNCRVYIFDGSEAWLYGFSQIPVFNVNECDIELKNQNKTIDEIEHYHLNNWQFVKLALESEKDILFRLKTRKPSKRGFFIRTVINYLDALQRAEKEQSGEHEPRNSIAYFIEESQDAFNSRSQIRLESEEFLTVFNEGRNQKEAFFTASQRLNDFSKTIRTKQIYVLGRISPEDRNTAIKQIEKLCNVDLSRAALRNWLFNGQIIKSPEWKQSGKPYIINRAIRSKYSNSLQTQSKPKMGLINALVTWFFSNPATTAKSNREIKEDSNESELDLYMSGEGENSVIFPTDKPEES